MREDLDQRPARADYNPEGLPERTIREAKVFELGPVTFPAYAGATAAASANMRYRSNGLRLIAVAAA